MNTNTLTSIRDTFTLSKMIFLLLVLSITLLTSGCGKFGGKKKDDKKDEEKTPIPVEVVVATRGDIQKTYRTITTLEAENDADVISRSTGVMQKILIEEGDMVTKGQLLAQLDVEQLALEVTQIAATLNKLKHELDRQQSLFKRNLGSKDALDRSRFDYQSQQAQHKLSKLRLNHASIKAPINGIVTERLVKQGNLIRDNTLLLKIVDLDSLIAVLHLPEKQMANVKKGQPVMLDIDAMNGKPVIGHVDRIRPSIDTDTGTFRVIAKLSNDNHFLKSGMFGKVEVVFDVHQDSLILDQSAVITQDNRSHVFVVTNGLAIQTPLTLGYRHNGLVEVLEGLTASDKVIITGQQILKHETKVEIINEDESSTESAATANSH
jgi:membrane fusion protein (multidrug efflux system)